MRREFLVSGIILGIIGVLILLLGIVKVPYTTTELVEVPKSDVWLNESIGVPAFHHYYYYNLADFPLGQTLHITFDVTEDESIDFWVMDQTNFMKFNASEPYEYYVVPSRPSISSLDTLWNPPTTGKIYFVWDNTASFTSKSVSVYFSLEWTEWEDQVITKNRTLLQTEASYLGVLLLVVGIVIVGYGLASKPPPVMPTTIEGNIGRVTPMTPLLFIFNINCCLVEVKSRRLF